MKPQRGDYVSLDKEGNFTLVDDWRFDFYFGLFLITDQQGCDYLVVRNDYFDTDLVHGWEVVRD